MKYAPAYVIALVIFLVLDALWLGLVAKSFYADRIGPIMLSSPRWGVAAVFYLIFVAGLVYFAISGALPAGNWQAAARDGALFGFFTYLTYDATTLAVIKGFDGTLAVVDVAWGTVLCAVTAALAVVLLAAFGLAGSAA